jgi:hypothetical protein
MQPNAGHQARRTAGARHERTLFAVAWMPLLSADFGMDSASKTQQVGLYESDPDCTLSVAWAGSRSAEQNPYMYATTTWVSIGAASPSSST